MKRKYKRMLKGMEAKEARKKSVEDQEKCMSRTQALVRECAVKALPRKKKEQLLSN